VRGEHDLGLLVQGVVQGGEYGADAGIFGDVLVVVERYVEVHAHEDLFAGQVVDFVDVAD